MNVPIIIIPDVHGRDFWRWAVAQRKEEDTVIFLGDYLDPYENEWIYWSDAYKGLLDIIALKQENPEKVVLLLGNHDLHYLFPSLRGSRYNEYQAKKIRKTFLDNLDCFQMAAEYEIDGQRFLFTHAGVNRMWVESHVDLFGPIVMVTAKTFNQLMFKETFVEALGDVSSLRWGKDRAGSMVWADVEEFEWSESRLPDVIQVFGHTLQDNGPRVIGNSMYCLDCKSAFVINSSGEIGRI
jgi:predicted phosphodiesterase